jgi:hypothetical protein
MDRKLRFQFCLSTRPFTNQRPFSILPCFIYYALPWNCPFKVWLPYFPVIACLIQLPSFEGNLVFQFWLNFNLIETPVLDPVLTGNNFPLMEPLVRFLAQIFKFLVSLRIYSSTDLYITKDWSCVHTTLYNQLEVAIWLKVQPICNFFEIVISW